MKTFICSQVDHVWAIEEGKRVARDIGGSDPVRMSPKNIVDYLEKEFEGTQVQIKSAPVSEADYPLAAAVNRGCKGEELRLFNSFVRLEILLIF